MPTHLKTAINDPDERAGDVEAPLYLSDGALHVGSTEGFGEVNKRQGDQEKLQRHTQMQKCKLCWKCVCFLCVFKKGGMD